MNSVSDHITIPSERLKLSISKLDQSDIVESYFSNVMQNLNSCINRNDTIDFERAASLIAGSKRKFIVTSRANSCCSCSSIFCRMCMKPRTLRLM